MVHHRRLRIMMVTPTPFFTDCGSHVRIYEEARALIRCGHAVRIICYHSGRDMPGIQTERITVPTLLRKLPLESPWFKPYLNFLLLKQAIRCARTFRPHLIHAHLPQGDRMGERLKKRLGIPLLQDCRRSVTDVDAITPVSVLHRFIRSRKPALNTGSADYTITSSTTLAQDLVTQCGVDKNSIYPMIDGVNTALFRPGPRTETRAKLKIPPTVPLVVYVGALNRAHGIDTLLSAIVQLQSIGSPLRFMIMGGGYEVYRAMARDLGIERMVMFTGTINYKELPLYLAASDFGVSPARSLTGANSQLLNYLACGLPTVAFDTPGNKEMLGEAGVYAEYGECSDLAAKLSWLAANREERIRLRTLGLAQVEQQHSWDRRGRALDEIYRVKLRR